MIDVIRFPVEKRYIARMIERYGDAFHRNMFGVSAGCKIFPQEFYIETDPQMWFNPFARCEWERNHIGGAS